MITKLFRVQEDLEISQNCLTPPPPPAFIHKNTGSCQRRQSEGDKSSKDIKYRNEHKDVKGVHKELHCLPFSAEENW